MGADKKKLLNLFSLGLGIVLAVLIAEAAIRIISPQSTGPCEYAFDPERGSIPVPGQKATRSLPGFYTFTYSNNSLGLRAKHENKFGRTGSDRILVLGDSYTYGVGVNNNETFCYYLEKGLWKRKFNVEVVNAGNPGSGTDYALKFLQVLGRRFYPKLVILAFSANDFCDNASGGLFSLNEEGHLKKIEHPFSRSIVAKKEFLRRNPVYNWLIMHSHLANLAKSAINQVIFIRLSRDKQAYPDTAIHYVNDLGCLDAKTIKLTGIYVGELMRAVRNSGSRFMIVYISNEREIDEYRKNKRLSEEELCLAQIAKNNNQPLFSLTPVLANTGFGLTDLFYREGHWTALAHKIGAGYMLKTIIRERLWKKETSLPK